MNQKPALQLKIRNATKEDIPFLFNSWLKSFRSAGLLCASVSDTVYYENHHKLLQKIMLRSTIYIACDPNYPDQILGYIVAEKIDGVFVLHYAYVKHNFRKVGIGRSLLNQFEHDTAAASCCTHLTRIGEKLSWKYNMIYHPYVILVDYEPHSSEDPLNISAPRTRE